MDQTQTASTSFKPILPESLLLLALNDKTGEIERSVSAERLHRALVVAALIELLQRGRLKLVPADQPIFSLAALVRMSQRLRLRAEDDQSALLSLSSLVLYELTDVTPVGRRYLDSFLTVFAALKPSERFHSLGGFGSIYTKRNGELSSLTGEPIRAAADLLENGILELLDTKAGRFFQPPSSYRLPTTGLRDSGEDSLRLSLVEAVSANRAANSPLSLNTETMMLLCLIRAVGLIEAVFGREKREAVDWRIASACRPESAPNTIYGFADRYTRSGPGWTDSLTIFTNPALPREANEESPRR